MVSTSLTWLQRLMQLLTTSAKWNGGMWSFPLPLAGKPTQRQVTICHGPNLLKGGLHLTSFMCQSSVLVQYSFIWCLLVLLPHQHHFWWSTFLAASLGLLFLQCSSYRSLQQSSSCVQNTCECESRENIAVSHTKVKSWDVNTPVFLKSDDCRCLLASCVCFNAHSLQNSPGLHSQLYKHCFILSFPAASKAVGPGALSFIVLFLTSGDCFAASERISVLTFSFQ